VIAGLLSCVFIWLAAPRKGVVRVPGAGAPALQKI
jgi:hypothetical protein